jgi:hypothetical protein
VDRHTLPVRKGRDREGRVARVEMPVFGLVQRAHKAGRRGETVQLGHARRRNDLARDAVVSGNAIRVPQFAEALLRAREEQRAGLPKADVDARPLPELAIEVDAVVGEFRQDVGRTAARDEAGGMPARPG